LQSKKSKWAEYCSTFAQTFALAALDELRLSIKRLGWEANKWGVRFFHFWNVISKLGRGIVCLCCQTQSKES
jgi:hypothetical protein